MAGLISISFLRGFPNFAFSSYYEAIAFTVLDTELPWTAKFTLSHGGETLISETYVPVNKIVTIYDLSATIESYITDSLLGTFHYKLEILSNGAIVDSRSADFTVLYCKSEVSEAAVVFVEDFFLTTMMGEKITAVKRKEPLHFCYTLTDEEVASSQASVAAVSVISTYIDESYTKTTVTKDWTVSLDKVRRQIVTIDVSPDQFIKVGHTLLKYEVAVGNRKQVYVLNRFQDTAPDIAFVNSFGCLDTLYFTGTQEVEPDLTRSAAYINGAYCNYFIEEKRMVKADTGVLPESMICLVDDLARSTKVYLIEKGELGRQITITESDTKRNDNLDTMFRFTITFRIMKNNQNLLYAIRPGKTFDSTFDNTFE